MLSVRVMLCIYCYMSKDFPNCRHVLVYETLVPFICTACAGL